MTPPKLPKKKTRKKKPIRFPGRWKDVDSLARAINRRCQTLDLDLTVKSSSGDLQYSHVCHLAGKAHHCVYMSLWSERTHLSFSPVTLFSAIIGDSESIFHQISLDDQSLLIQSIIEYLMLFYRLKDKALDSVVSHNKIIRKEIDLLHSSVSHRTREGLFWSVCSQEDLKSPHLQQSVTSKIPEGKETFITYDVNRGWTLNLSHLTTEEVVTVLESFNR